MWKPAILLVISLILLPLLIIQMDLQVSDLQWVLILKLSSLYVILAVLCFILSSLTKNYSQVDKLWSTVPIVYALIICYYAGYEPRIILMTCLVAIWGLRLSYNFGRRGGYKLKFWEGEEDYRWSVLQQRKEFSPSWKWTLFNLVFISFYQMGLILLFTLPIVKAVGGKPLGIWDIILAIAFVGLVVIEWVADNQQFAFQKKKHENPKAINKGFLDKGLWAKVRHPNYAAEQLIWLVFYLLSVVASSEWVNWSIAGTILLFLLFKGSSDFSENISADKYPAYKAYQEKVPRFWPIKF